MYSQVNQPNKDSDQPNTRIVGIANEFKNFIGSYSCYFKTATGSVDTQAEQYLCGLMEAKRRNMERMAEVVPNCDDQSLQNFLTNSPWCGRSVLDRIAQDVDDIFGDDPDTCLLVDESGILKKGNKSVGVKRQWCGRYGKVDNCQVGVYLALSCRENNSLIDTRLYLPETWANDPERCREAGLPEEHIVFKTKSELALEMVAHAHSTSIRFNWIGADGGYGKEPGFLRSLDSDGHIFVVDVHKDQRIYLENPKPTVPEPKPGKGRNPTRLVAQCDPIRVDKWTNEQPESEWQRITVRKTTRGKLDVDILHMRVWLWDGEEAEAHCWHLIVRREIASQEEIKYTLSNAPEETSTERLAFMQGQRYWVERSIQDGKSECGLADYQVRLWNGWHHHMVLVMMAMLFMLKTRMTHKDQYSLLSCADIVELLAHFLPRRDVTVAEILRQMEERHRRRQSSIDSASRKETRFIASRGG